MNIDILSIGIFRCRPDDESDTIRVLPKEELNEFQSPVSVTDNLLTTLTTRNFISAKNARVHKFTKEAEKPRDVEAISTRELLRECLEEENIRENFETLASWYHQTNYSRPGLLIITYFKQNEVPQLAILKAPFMNDAYQADDDQILKETDSIVKSDLKKGILYPRITPDNAVNSDEACIYQREGSSKQFPEHWYRYLHLEPSKTPEERFAEHLKEEGESSPVAEVESTDEFGKIIDNLNGGIGESVVSISIGDRDVKVRLNELLERDGIHLVESNRGYHLVISGDRPEVKFSGIQGGAQQILKGISDYDQMEEVFE